jgi:predicted DNA-binding transcriptional regulator AlpA
MPTARELRYEAVPPPTRRGLSRVEAAGYIGVSPTLFDRMVADGSMPPPKRVCGRVIWDRKALDRAFEALPGGDDSAQAIGEDNEWNELLT